MLVFSVYKKLCNGQKEEQEENRIGGKKVGPYREPFP